MKNNKLMTEIERLKLELKRKDEIINSLMQNSESMSITNRVLAERLKKTEYENL